MNRYYFILMFFTLMTAITSCTSTPRTSSKNKELRITVDSEPTSLDPRIGGNRKSQIVIRMLYEGLGRYNRNGEVEFGIAESYEYSDDFKTLTVHLKDTQWSNGVLVTADDFAEAWKEALDPHFQTVFAYIYYIFKNGKAAKAGEVPLDQVGVKALDEKTLLIEFENPFPDFLELATSPLFFPVYRGDADDGLVTNGPFTLVDWKPKQEIRVKKNPLYWDSSKVPLQGINIAVVDDPTTGFLMWDRGEVDMFGGPMSPFPMEAILPMKEKGKLMTFPSSGVFWIAFNTTKSPFNSAKIRKAFAYAVDRRSLVDHLLQGNEAPSTSILPQFLSLQNAPYFRDANVKEARKLFEEGLKELNLTREEVGAIELNFCSTPDEKAIAQVLQQTWVETFNIPIELLGTERGVYFAKATNGDYQFRTATWYPYLSSPSDNMDFLKTKDDKVNVTRWENPQFRHYMELAASEGNPKKRKEYFHHAERIVIQEMPIAPIFYSTYKLVKHDNIDGFVITETGYPDFKWITIK